jgi:hypothetical protein
MAKTFAALPHFTLRDVLDRAAERCAPATRFDLAARIGIHVATWDQWKADKRLPSDVTMLPLCNLAGFDAAEGLLLLNIWRSDGLVRSVYIKLLQQLGYHYILRSSPGYCGNRHLWRERQSPQRTK